MDNRDVAGILETIAHLLELQGENAFKVRAYQNAARTVEGLSQDLRALVREKTLGEVPGIGEALEQKITQLVTTGKMEYFEKLRSEVPPGLLRMLEIPSLGPKKVKVLWQDKKITTIEALRKACEEDALLDLKGFGEKTQKKILEGIAFLGRHQGQARLDDAMTVARKLLEHLKNCPAVQRLSTAGSLRRWKEVVGDVDLLASSGDPAAVMDHFVGAPGLGEILGKGETKTSVRLGNGLQVDLRVVSDEQFPFALNYFTGSKEHNVALRQIAQKKGLKLSEYGIFKGSKLIECADEEAIYRELGLPYLPPEMRENTGELDLKQIPQLIGPQSLKGVFHTHSTWSDGTADIEAMAQKARSMGLTYLGLSDHSGAATYANGMDESRLRQQMKEIDRLNATGRDFRILKGLECDILPSGELDLNPKILGELDFVIGSVHSRFEMSQEEMTRRVCRALANEHLDFLGHSTGRLLLSRDAYKIDLDRVIDEAARQHKIIELNSHPSRLDLDWVHCRQAKEKGVMLSINPDAHSTSDLENIEYGVATARRAWLEEKDVLNTRNLDEVCDLLGIG
ncbi:MAG TPA: DNA polymerase/3'-5' exonuclease PolX [Planctomycetota bacterium]|nr:DNA polymerase/3'-5' exonuclease PolX [Planctomycetota bacterium]